MITTVCMNPSFDKTAVVEGLIAGGLNRLADVRSDVGGKGINVAIVLQRLGVPVSCVGCVGAANELEFLAMIHQEQLSFTYLSLPGKTRTNLKILDQETKTVTEFNEQGISMDATQQQAFIALLKK